MVREQTEIEPSTFIKSYMAGGYMVEQFALYIGSNHKRQHHLHRNLELLRINLHGASTVHEARGLMQNCYYHLTIMHYGAVGKEIFRLCSFIRSHNDHSIMIVLMVKARIHIEERLFDCGVSDIVVNPQTSSRVLTKRIQAHLREINPHWHQNNTIRLKDAIIDLERREVQRNGSCHQLRGLLADLLKYFLDNPDRIISREELRESPIWADSICSSANEGGKTFDVNIGKLRKIIESDPSRPQIIQSVRGVGWKLAITPVPMERTLHIEMR
ncbi:MAG: response regulator transcription factor [Planctomycetes bacterium]|nr:response regulator transcription factor [Planctomycetota bacterium]